MGSNRTEAGRRIDGFGTGSDSDANRAVTGTPAGVGVFRKLPVFLKHGDEVQCEIEELGTICNRVV